ncbi:MAG TPA: hypothetical protein PLM16_01080 [Candidatus Woesebacteria bacterium]|nr:hypothetical protein [Candidatus Woesebacteria bacterium]
MKNHYHIECFHQPFSLAFRISKSVFLFICTSIFSFFILAFAIIKPTQIQALDDPLTCQNFIAEVQNNEVSIIATGCNNDGTYVIAIHDSSGKHIGDNTIIINYGNSKTVKFTIDQPGEYDVYLLESGEIVSTTKFTIINQGDGIQCGDQVLQTDSNSCPVECPIQHCANGQSFCFLDQSQCPRVFISYATYSICNQIDPSSQEKINCMQCFNSDGIWTAVGCIPVEPESMIKTLIRISLLVGGGVSFIIILAGSFILSTSKGEPKKITEAKEMITSALIGLVFIIFSISILQLIGVQILHIPDFGI